MKILLQGDSITDAGRSRENDEVVGEGYSHLVKAHLNFEYPNQHVILNRGISGNRIVDLYARIKKDFINLAPDYASILIGVNDVWHEFSYQNGVDTAKFETLYNMMVEELFAALPNLKLVIMGAYVLPGRATFASEGEDQNKYAAFRGETEERAAVAKRVAEKFGLPFIDLQKAFDEAAEKNGPATYTGDGVHPNAAGQELIKREWLKVFNSLQ